MHTVTVEVTPRERADLARALRALADEETADEKPGEADRLRRLAGRIERG
jgi:hypothetical protein